MDKFKIEKDRQIYGRYQPLRWRILVSGASGLIGSRLTGFLCGAGCEVVHLVRKRSSAPNEIFWDPKIDLEGFDAVIHLAGKNISSKRWSCHVKQELFLSRCQSTQRLSQALAQLARPPKCFITASATGIYGNRGEETLTEESSPGSGFLAHLCQKWEAATSAAEQADIRVVHTRFGVVLSKEGGMLAKLLPSFRLGLGAILGDGKQYLPWILLDDLVYGLFHVLANETLRGPVNFVAPDLKTQAEFSHALAHTLHRPCFVRLPAPLLRLLLGEMADEMLLSSAKVLPKRLQLSGFKYTCPTLNEALKEALRLI